ncbi:exosome complex component RRP40-like [Stegodyphus dumicola]|uniref:exosome complex component RRP40-like n=1 Tax=Stegodyphus dumicola TaxID=202533 RepID=UPI0015B1A19E|nr:exosome complex component RRP40-like [Stegodyphus dumicola]
MERYVNDVVMPGDVLLELNTLEGAGEKIVFGPGLRRESDKIIASKCGILKQTSSKVFYVDNHQMRYIPVRGDNVIGVVIKKGADEIQVDIGCSEPAVVDMLSFEGATKRNKPMIKIGDIIYAKILVACKDIEPELVCVNSYGKSVGYGVLPDEGFVFPASLEYCRRLLLPNSPILKRLGENLGFEIAIGLNGRIWLKSTTIEKTLILVQAITVLEYATSQEIEKMCEQMTSMSVT